MPEKYGVYAQLVPSVASTPVDTSTNIVFIGAAKIELVDGWENKDLINHPIYISSLSDYEKKLGGGLASDGFNLTEAAEAAFSVVGISGAYFHEVRNQCAKGIHHTNSRSNQRKSIFQLLPVS